MADYPLELTKVVDETVPQRDGSYTRFKTYTFYLGKYGPFTERVPATDFDDAEFSRRVEKLRSHLTLITL